MEQTNVLLHSLLHSESDQLIQRSSSHQLYLNPSHPSTPSILASAGVHLERLTRPLVTFYRHDKILDQEELARVFQHAGERYNWTVRGGVQVDLVSYFLESYAGS